MTTAPALEPLWPSQHIQAVALASELQRMGFKTVVFKKDGHLFHPCVWVACGDREEFIYVAPDDDDRWWFWWSSLVPIALMAEINVTADSVSRRLALPLRRR